MDSTAIFTTQPEPPRNRLEKLLGSHFCQPCSMTIKNSLSLHVFSVQCSYLSS
jgi:hypothetical protein